MSSPPPPSSKIEWAKLGLTVDDIVNGHIESTYTVGEAQWTPPQLVKDPYIRIHGLSPALNYGMQAYEGLKAVRTPAGTIALFRPEFHADRMQHSATTVSMPPVPQNVFISCIEAAVRANAEFVGPADSAAVLYVRPVLFAVGPQLALEPPSRFAFAVYVQPATTYHGIQPLPCLIMEHFDRTATRGTGHAKIGGNYAPMIKFSQEAKKKGFYMTLHLDSATMTEIEEFSTSGFIGVKAGTDGAKGTLCIPDSKQVIASVTSDTVQVIAKQLGYVIENRAVKFDELKEFSEVLAVGTAGESGHRPRKRVTLILNSSTASVLSIAAIVREGTGDKFLYCTDGKPCPVATELEAAVTSAIRGRSEDLHGWLHEVPFPES